MFKFRGTCLIWAVTTTGPALKQSVTLDCCAYETGLIDLMIGSYLSHGDVIKITWGSISRKTRANVRDFREILGEWKSNTTMIKKSESYRL